MIDTHSIMYITNRPDITMVSGEGSWLTDNEGKRYLDFMQGWVGSRLDDGVGGCLELFG